MIFFLFSVCLLLFFFAFFSFRICRGLGQYQQQYIKIHTHHDVTDVSTAVIFNINWGLFHKSHQAICDWLARLQLNLFFHHDKNRALFTKCFVWLGRIHRKNRKDPKHFLDLLKIFSLFRPQKQQQRKSKSWRMFGNIMSLTKLLPLFFCFDWEELEQLTHWLNICLSRMRGMYHPPL